MEQFYYAFYHKHEMPALE